MDLRTRKRLSLLVLCLGLPAWIVVSLVLTAWLDDRFGRLPVLVELAVFVGLGIVWILPFRRLFRGIGKAEE